MIRCFISIDIPEGVKKQIEIIQNSLPEFIGKKVELENLHLTLKFLGEINEKKLEEIKKKLREIKFDSFNVKLDSAGIFSESFIRIVWLHIGGVEKLQKQVDNILKGIFKPEVRFMSHLTIARIKKIKNKEKFLDKIKGIKISKIIFKIDSFKLKKSELFSQGPKYSTLEEYKLA